MKKVGAKIEWMGLCLTLRLSKSCQTDIVGALCTSATSARLSIEQYDYLGHLGQCISQDKTYRDAGLTFLVQVLELTFWLKI